MSCNLIFFYFNIPTFDVVEEKTCLLAASWPVDDFHEVVVLPFPKLQPLFASLAAAFVEEIGDLTRLFFLYASHLIV